MAKEFDQILTGSITVKKNGAHTVDPNVLACAITNYLEALLDPMGESCELDLIVNVEIKEQEQ